MVFLDDPDHARLRGLVAQAFSARAVDAMRPRIASIAETLLDGIDTSKPFDLVAEYATPLPIIVITEMLGVRDADVESFRLWSDQTKLFFDPERTEETNAVLWSAIANLNACLADVVAERRRSGDDDLISGLVAAEASGSRLTDTEIVDTCRALLVARNITTTDLIGTGLVSLLRHPDQLDAVRQEPRRWPHAIEEMLRHDAPVTAWNRQALDDRTIDGCRIEAGQTITSMLAAANHDPSIHADPHRFDIARDGQRHFSFGGGSHFCLGASLARLEAQIAMASLVSRFPRLALTRDRPERKTQPGFSGYAAVWLTAA
ncbi:MAG: cytochrome P450 [Sphingomonas sp.]|nr:MAG: cytochrome P450 [Sphingomonas sp.]